MKWIIIIIFILVFSIVGGAVSSLSGLLPSTIGTLISGIVGALIPMLFEHFSLHGQPFFFWWQCKHKLKDEEIYLSFSYLYRIEMDGKYLLVRGNRLKNQYQPVGGVYKYYPEAKDFLRSIHFRPNTKMGNTDETDDLRISVRGKYLLQFIDWFSKGQNRESDPKREFNEELVKSGLLNSELFENLKFTKVHTHNKGILKSEYDPGYEWIYAEIYALDLTTEQKAAIRKAVEDHPDKLILASAEELRNLRYGDSVERNLGNNAPWLIE